jgi:hypothetical protein
MFFAADYQPEVGFMKRLPDAAEILRAALKTQNWGTTAASGYFVRDLTKRLFFTIDLQRLGGQAIGVQAWESSLNDYASAFRHILEQLGVKTLKRIGFRVQTFVPTGMSHAEMVDLSYGSFLAPAQELKDICGKPEDALAQLHGAFEDMKLQLIIAPMNSEHVNLQIGAVPNLEHFLESRFFDSGLKEFRERVMSDCLFIDIDLSRQNYNYADVLVFMRESFRAADTVATLAIERLKSLRKKRGTV